MSATTLITPAQFEEYVLAHPDQKIELNQGELVIVARAKLGHEMVKANIFGFLFAFTLTNPIARAFSETMYRLGREIERQPDVSLVLNGTLDNTSRNRMPDYVPDFVAEVISTNDKAEEVHEKIQQYREAGVKIIWEVYLSTRKIIVHDQSGMREYSVGDTLELPGLLPGFKIEVGKLFD